MSHSQTPMMVFPDPTPQHVPFYQNFELMSSWFIGFLIISFGLYKALRIFIIRFFTIPPDNYRNLIETAMNGSGMIGESKIGVKSGSVRRRLVLAASKPQLYSTVPLNTNQDTDCTQNKFKLIRIAKIDKEENPKFLENIKPRSANDPNRPLIYGFFHPNSDANGGGERVLWEAVYQTLKLSNKDICAIYTFTATNDTSVSSILKNVELTFGLNFFENSINDRIVFIQLPNRWKWVIDGKRWSHFTIICQALGSIFISLKAFHRLSPDIFIDTMGFPFTYPLASFFMGLPVVAYVHYPLISSDMLNKLNLKTPYGLIKFGYWSTMMKLYEVMGVCVDVTFCNSTWTLNHIRKVWKSSAEMYPPSIMYPPIGIDEERIAGDPVNDPKERVFLYIAQYRPEKRHELVLQEYSKYLTSLTNQENAYKLVFIGSTRSSEDERTVTNLRKLAKTLTVSEFVTFNVNSPRKTVDEYLLKSEFGLNAMWNEHFGISVVEYMLNGLIPIVHASAGPLQDIVMSVNPSTKEILSAEQSALSKDLNSKSGFFFKDPSDPDYDASLGYDSLSGVFSKVAALNIDEKLVIRSNASYVARSKFGKNVFKKEWTQFIRFIEKLELYNRTKKGKVEQVY